MKLRAYIAALHAALFAILLAVSPAGSGSMTLLGAGKPRLVVVAAGLLSLIRGRPSTAEQGRSLPMPAEPLLAARRGPWLLFYSMAAQSPAG
jgi:hypothetical protein